MNMDLQVINMASSSSSAAAHVLPQDKYDVFLSYRGIDTRQKFTSYLYDALKRIKVDAYMDNRIDRGDEIEHALVEAIEQSKISIIVFSKNFASSRWCLDELVHILKCKQRYGRIVIPVFYEIDPSHVRKQEGSYADAFIAHEERFKNNMDKVLLWRKAMSTAANLSGFDSENIRPEPALVERIVNAILAKLNRNSSTIVRGLVGFESQIQQIELLLCIEAQDVELRLVGIWGMGGIGKTTLADAVYHRISSKFDTCKFLSNVREESGKRGINHLRDELFRKLLMDESLKIDSPSIGSHVLDKLSRTKVLVVLDDVNESEQLEYLLGQQVVFGRGSRVIITSRDRRPLIEKVKADHIYKVIELNDADALELFHLKASKDGASKIDNSDLLEGVVSYAQGIPLVLKVLGSLFHHCNSEKDCEDKLKILKKYPDKKIQELLRVSYNGLQEHEKGIFLDIACFFKGEKMCDVERLIEMHGFCAPLQGIQVLIDMSLISISMNNRLEMHDLMQEMGMSIVREQCAFDPGSRRNRLWSAEDVYQVLRYNTGTTTVEAMFVDMSTIQDLQLNRTTFTNMHSLKLLKFYVPFKFSDEYVDKVSKVYLAQGLESLPEGLRYLYWDRYRSKSLPSKFLPCNLVELHMSYSVIEKLWSNGKNLSSLKVIDLSHSKELCEVPDLSESPNIEEINLHGCISLAEVPSFKNLDKLTSLNLSWCLKLETFPDEMPCNMRFLDLSHCYHLIKVPDLSLCANIENINLADTKLVEIPSYFQHLDKLTSLNLAYCQMLEYLPELPCNVEYLDLYSCGRLKELPNSIYKLNRLETLNLQFCSTLENLPPFSVGLCSLRELNLGGCNRLQIPDGLICLSSLHILNLEYNMIESIPGSIKNVFGLRILKLTKCTKLQSLPELPPLLEILEADGCTSLQRVASSRTTVHQYEDPYYREELLMLIDCVNLNESSRSNIMDDARSRITQMASSKVHKTKHPDRYSVEDSVTIIYPGNEIPEWFSYRAEGCSVEIEFSPDWFYYFLGFALCAVVASEFIYELECHCNYKTNNGEGYGYEFRTPNLRGARTNSDHVLWSFTKGKHSSAGDSPIPFTKVAKASFHFYPSMSSESKLKACGIRLLYAQERPQGMTLLTNAGEAIGEDPMDFEDEEDPMDFEEALDFISPRERSRDMMMMVESEIETQDGTTSDDDPNSPTHEH